MVALVVFLAALGYVLYIILGYPVLLGLLTVLRRDVPVRRDRQQLRSVSLILPVLNGARWIESKLESIRALDYPRELLQVIVVDDGSSDGSAELASRFADERVEVLTVPHGGKPLALNAGIARATGEILFFTDIRQRLDPLSLRSLVSCFASPDVGVVSGELIILSGETQQEADIGMYWRYEKWIRKRLSRRHSVMGATGSIYAMRRSLAEPLPPHTLVDDMHLPIGAFFKGYRIVFDESARAFDYPTALESEFKRKVRTLAGNYQILAAYPRLLLPVHPMWIHFVSHKLGRLFLPFALAAMALSTPFLPRRLAVMAGAGQVVGYMLALCDPLVPAGFRIKRLTSIARTFVVMMLAAAKASMVWFLDSRKLWQETVVTRPVR